MCVFERSSPWKGSRLVFGSALVQDTATDFAQLKAALTKHFPVVRNRKYLESQFNASQQNRYPTNFIDDKLKVHRTLEAALVDHIFVRLESQVQDYIEVRNPTTTAELLEVLAKFGERYSYKKMQDSKNSGNVERRGWNDSRGSNHDDRKRNRRNSEVLHRPSNVRNNSRGNYESGCQRRNQWFESSKELNRDDRRFDRGYHKSKIVLDFDRKALAIPDLQNEKVVTTIEEGNVEIHLTKTGLEESQKKELQNLFNSFKELFSDKLGLTHVLYHEIDMGDKPPVVSRTYHYDRVKQNILEIYREKVERWDHNTDSISVRIAGWEV
ncbi:uncharacterized protein TNCV_1728671 [Trichonephila clavipes]|nr:uncharacterized protein TNCV_1728671 [Trichonephila clavipes]